jgi:membrane protein YdbS with pleckstrin-like domain
MKEEWIMFELEYLKRLSYFQIDSLLLLIAILSAMVFYLFASMQNSLLLEALVVIFFIPVIAFFAFETYKDGSNLMKLLNEELKRIGGEVNENKKRPFR